MSVIEEVCCVKGHDIQSHVVGDVIDPAFKVVVHGYEWRCTQCGKTLAEIEKYKLSSRGKARQKKETTNDNNRRRASQNQPASSEASATESLPGSEPAVSGSEV